MTVIAYKDGVMAADSRAYSGGTGAIGRKWKVRRAPDGTLIGCSSNQPGVSEAAMAWYIDGADPEKAPKLNEPSFSLLAVRPDGRAFIADDRFLLSGPLEGEVFATGSGGYAAHGAMLAGRRPKRRRGSPARSTPGARSRSTRCGTIRRADP